MDVQAYRAAVTENRIRNLHATRLVLTKPVARAWMPVLS